MSPTPPLEKPASRGRLGTRARPCASARGGAHPRRSTWAGFLTPLSTPFIYLGLRSRSPVLPPHPLATSPRLPPGVPPPGRSPGESMLIISNLRWSPAQPPSPRPRPPRPSSRALSSLPTQPRWLLVSIAWLGSRTPSPALPPSAVGQTLGYSLTESRGITALFPPERAPCPRDYLRLHCKRIKS